MTQFLKCSVKIRVIDPLQFVMNVGEIVDAAKQPTSWRLPLLGRKMMGQKIQQGLFTTILPP